MEVQEEDIIYETDDNYALLDTYRSLIVSKLERLQKSINIEDGDEFTFCSKQSRFSTISEIISLIKNT